MRSPTVLVLAIGLAAVITFPSGLLAQGTIITQPPPTPQEGCAAAEATAPTAQAKKAVRDTCTTLTPVFLAVQQVPQWRPPADAATTWVGMPFRLTPLYDSGAGLFKTRADVFVFNPGLTPVTVRLDLYDMAERVACTKSGEVPSEGVSSFLFEAGWYSCPDSFATYWVRVAASQPVFVSGEDVTHHYVNQNTHDVVPTNVDHIAFHALS